MTSEVLVRAINADVEVTEHELSNAYIRTIQEGSAVLFYVYGDKRISVRELKPISRAPQAPANDE